MDFFNKEQNYQPSRGSLLLSEPLLADPNFERTVVLLCENTNDGAFGFVLNKKSEMTVADVMQDIEMEIPLFIGGPVEQDTLHFIHRVPDQVSGSIEIRPGIYWGGDFEDVLQAITLGLFNADDYRFFLGYSGWGYEQLIMELKENSWIVREEYDVNHIFHQDPTRLWKKSLSEMGERYKMFTNYPIDPRLN